MGRVFRVVAAFCEGCSGCDPASVAAHDLEDVNDVVLTHGLGVAREFANSGGNVFDDGAVSRSVIGADEIVIDGLWNPDTAHFPACGAGVLGDFVGGVLAIVSADVEEVADIVCFADVDDTVVVGVFFQFKAASAKCRRRGIAKPADRLLTFFGEVHEVLFDDAENAIEAAVYFFDALVVEGFADYSSEARIDDRSGSATLGDEDVTDKFFCHGLSKIKDENGRTLSL